jgi:hypothetical protein
MEIYEWHKAYHDKTPYGNEIAEKVSDFLEKNGFIAYNHRDYCGMAFIQEEDIYYYCTCHDGVTFYAEKAFNDKKSFFEWLAIQSDDTMSRKYEPNIEPSSIDNQCITKERLLNFPLQYLKEEDKKYMLPIIKKHTY